MAKGVRFKDILTQFDSLQKEIAARRFSPIYLLMGEEGYFIDKLSNLLADSILTPEEQAFNQVVVYGKDTNEDAIINMARQMPMMGQYQVIIIKEAAQLPNIDRLTLYTEKPSESTILVICHKGKNVDKRTALYKHALAKGVVFESPKPYDNELTDWLSNHIRQQGLTIEPKALSMLTDHLGTDITKIAKELEKLFVSMPADTKTITAGIIENNIGISKDFNIFELLKAVGTRDKAKAFIIADYFASNPRSVYISVAIRQLFDYFQKLFLINYKRWQQTYKKLPMPSDKELADLIGTNIYFLGEYKQAANLYNNKKIFTIFGLLREYDMRSKGIGGGTINDSELFKELLLKIFSV